MGIVVQRLLLLLLVVATVAFSCGAEPTDEDELAALAPTDPALQPLLAELAAAFERAPEAWPGFVPARHPIVLTTTTTGPSTTPVVALNHPDPDSLGDIETLRADSRLGASHRVQPNDQTRSILATVNFARFHVELGDVDSFVFALDDWPTTDDAPDVAITVMHELFHRHQDATFDDMNYRQDFENYDFSATNLAAAMLEDRIIQHALTVEADQRRSAAADVTALRSWRLSRDLRVVLDEDQERIEGSARWLEHRLDLDGARHRADNVAWLLAVRPAGFDDGQIPIADHFAFGRWYSSGAALIELAIELDVPDVLRRIEEGATPMELIEDHLGEQSLELEPLVAQLFDLHDPDRGIRDRADEWARRVLEES